MTEPRTKIVATVGPACDDESTLARMVLAGADVLRLNFSHGTHEQHARTIERILRVRRDLDLPPPHGPDGPGRLHRPVAILQDFQGPRIRTGRLRNPEGVRLVAGRRLTIAAGDFLGDEDRIATGYERLAEDARPGNVILLCDGAIELRILAAEAGEVHCEVVAGDILGERRGM
ncbi:MAG: pyruvate kinase, partial [Candidatus Brocadiia bacterium]|nr:pyruvate kinase [Candidatus Brocadiia bacterium]